MTWGEWVQRKIEYRIPIKLPVYFYWNYKKATECEYVVYQTEQLNLSDKSNHGWFKFMDNAVKVYDFSIINQQYYPSEFLPIYPEPSESNCGDEIDILFYGHITPRRQKIIDELGATVIEALEMDKLKYYVNRSRKVLVIGCYNNIYADPFRICPALDMGGNVLMEHTQETWLENYLIKNMPNRITFL